MVSSESWMWITHSVTESETESLITHSSHSLEMDWIVDWSMNWIIHEWIMNDWNWIIELILNDWSLIIWWLIVWFDGWSISDCHWVNDWHKTCEAWPVTTNNHVRFVMNQYALKNSATMSVDPLRVMACFWAWAVAAIRFEVLAKAFVVWLKPFEWPS